MGSERPPSHTTVHARSLAHETYGIALAHPRRQHLHGAPPCGIKQLPLTDPSAHAVSGPPFDTAAALSGRSCSCPRPVQVRTGRGTARRAFGDVVGPHPLFGGRLGQRANLVRDHSETHHRCRLVAGLARLGGLGAGLARGLDAVPLERAVEQLDCQTAAPAAGTSRLLPRTRSAPGPPPRSRTATARCRTRRTTTPPTGHRHCGRGRSSSTTRR